MKKPTPKRIGLLRWIRDFADEARGIPCYTSFSCAPWMRLNQYYLWEDDSRVLLAAHRAGLIRFKDQECFSFLTEEGKALLEKYKNLYPEIPSGKYGERPELRKAFDIHGAG